MSTLSPGPWEEQALFDPVAYDHPTLKQVWETWLEHCGAVHPRIAEKGLTEKAKGLVYAAVKEFGMEAVCGAIQAASEKKWLRQKTKKGNGPFLKLTDILSPDHIEAHIKSWSESPEQKFINE